MILAAVAGVDIAVVIVVVGAIGMLLDRGLEVLGWSRSARTLRQENSDLARYNNELVDQNKALLNRVGEHTQTIFEQGIHIAELDEKLTAVRRNDQAAVLTAMREHERNVVARHTENVKRTAAVLGVLEQIRDSLGAR